jgi:hypothetical protein
VKSSTEGLQILDRIRNNPEVHASKSAKGEDLEYRADDFIYEAQKRLVRRNDSGEPIKDSVGNQIIESEAETISRAINKFVKNEPNDELRIVSETIIASGVVRDIEELSSRTGLSRAQRRNLARSAAGFNHRVGSVLEQIGDRVELGKISGWLGEYNNDRVWGENIVNGAAAELGMLDVLKREIQKGM